jgi:hypothetical protein
VRIQDDEFEGGRLRPREAFLATAGKAEIHILIQQDPLDPGHPIIISSDDENAHGEPPAKSGQGKSLMSRNLSRKLFTAACAAEHASASRHVATLNRCVTGV